MRWWKQWSRNENWSCAWWKTKYNWTSDNTNTHTHTHTLKWKSALLFPIEFSNYLLLILHFHQWIPHYLIHIFYLHEFSIKIIYHFLSMKNHQPPNVLKGGSWKDRDQDTFFCFLCLLFGLLNMKNHFPYENSMENVFPVCECWLQRVKREWIWVIIISICKFMFSHIFFLLMYGITFSPEKLSLSLSLSTLQQQSVPEFICEGIYYYFFRDDDKNHVWFFRMFFFWWKFECENSYCFSCFFMLFFSLHRNNNDVCLELKNFHIVAGENWKMCLLDWGKLFENLMEMNCIRHRISLNQK